MTLRDLEYVCAVGDLRHFGKAAEACHVGQPTLSGQIRRLEEHLGVVLFERTKRTVRLTPIGAKIVELARATLQAAGRIEEAARAHRDPESGRLRLGLIPTIAPYLIPRFLAPLGKRFPRLQAILQEDVTAVLLGRIEAGELDGAILATPPGETALRSLPLYREPFWVALPRGHRLSKADAVTPSALEPGELLLLTDGHCLKDQALAVCGLATAAAGADTRAASLETILNLVSAGYGITLVPALVLRDLRFRQLRLVARRFDAPDAERTVRLVYRAGYPHESLLARVAAVVRRSVPASLITPIAAG
jgi:LysR family hydrogen peroxide-inducible transcriptional activator